MGTLIVLRGLPGSGKTRFRKMLFEVCGGFETVSADHYFQATERRPQDLQQAHTQCFKEAMNIMAGNKYNRLLVDNTNLQRFEVQPYFMLAQAHYWQPVVVRLSCDLATCAARNVHNVSHTHLQRMVDNAEAPLPFWPKEVVFENPSFDDVLSFARVIGW